GASDRCGVEVSDSGRCDVKRTALQSREPLTDQLRSAINQARFFGAVFEGLPRNFVVVAFVGLTEVGRIAVGNGPLLTHPVNGGAGIESAGKRNADAFAGR